VHALTISPDVWVEFAIDEKDICDERLDVLLVVKGLVG
jgi:hypothetical protein